MTNPIKYYKNHNYINPFVKIVLIYSKMEFVNYKDKYLRYKTKYQELKNSANNQTEDMIGGALSGTKTLNLNIHIKLFQKSLNLFLNLQSFPNNTSIICSFF